MGLVAIIIGLIGFVAFILLLMSCFITSSEMSRLEEEMEKIRIETEKHD